MPQNDPVILPESLKGAKVESIDSETELPEFLKGAKIEAIDSKKKASSEPAGTTTANGSATSDIGGEEGQSKPTYSVKPDEGPMRKGKPQTVVVGGKEFSTENSPDMTSSEVKGAAQKLFKIASPVTQSKAQDISDHPALKGISKDILQGKPEPAFENISSKVVLGNEDILSAYLKTLPESEQNRLRNSKLNDEQSLELLYQAYSPMLDQSINDLSILRSRGVENDIKTLDNKYKQINTLAGTVNTDKDALVKLQTTYLTQNGYDGLSKQFKENSKQLQVKQDELKPLFDKKTQLEGAISQFDPLIKDGQFTGNKQEYDNYVAANNEYQNLVASPEFKQYNSLIAKQNELVKNINQIVTPEFKEQEKALTEKVNNNIQSIQGVSTDLNEYLTPERQDQINQYQEALKTYNGITDKLHSVKSKMPEVIAKEDYLNSWNKFIEVNSDAKTYDLASRTLGGFTQAVGSMLSSVPAFAGGLSDEYSPSDRAAQSITDLFAPSGLNSKSTVAGRALEGQKQFYDSETDHIDWSALPNEIADQVGGFAILAGTGMLGGMAGFSDAVSIVLPGTMMSYNDAYKTGQQIYRNDPMSATAYAAASSFITGVTELIMPDRDILTGGVVDDLAKGYVANYIKKGKRYAVEQSVLSLTEMMGKEVGEEFVDRWKDVLLSGVVNMTGGETNYNIPSINEQLSIAASTAALTGVGGVYGQVNKNGKTHQLAVYEAAQNYPETLGMLDTMTKGGENPERIEQIKSEVSDMFVTLKQVPSNLSVPKRLAVYDKLKQIQQLEDAMASGISPHIVDKMKGGVKVIADQIQEIIVDPNFDKQFAAEVNKEVTKPEPEMVKPVEVQPTPIEEVTTTEADVEDQPIEEVANEEAVVDVEFTAKGGNKIVDSKGDPITLLHGTNDDKINFDEGTVFYATDNKQFADVYGENHLPVKITLKKPYDLTDSVDGVIKDANGEPMLDKEGKPYSINYIDESVVKDLKSRGFDGVRLGNESVVAFDKSQVKAVEQSLPTQEVKDNTKPTISKEQPTNVSKEEGSGVGGDVVKNEFTGADEFYHGTNKQFDKFEKQSKAGQENTITEQPIFLAEDKGMADANARGAGARTLSVKVKGGKFFDFRKDLFENGKGEFGGYDKLYNSLSATGKKIYDAIDNGEIDLSKTRFSDYDGYDVIAKKLVTGDYDFIEIKPFKEWLENNGYDGAFLKEHPSEKSANLAVWNTDKLEIIRSKEQSLPPTPEVKPNEPSIVTHIVPLLELTPTAEGQTKEAITTNQNEKEANQKRVEKGLLTSESTKTEPVSEAEVQSTTDKKIEAANKRIDDVAKTIKDVLKINVTPKGTQKSGTDSESIVDMITQATKHLVAGGIKTQAALEQVIKTLKDAGHIAGKEITKFRNFATSQLDLDHEKVWVSKDGKNEVFVNDLGDLVAKNSKGKLLDPKESKKVIKEYVQTKDLTRGKLADLTGVREDQAASEIASNSENPMQIAQAMAFTSKARTLTEDEVDFKTRTIAEHLPAITTESFVHGKDAADLIDEKGKFQEGTSIAFNYLRKDGHTLDEAVQIINSDARFEKDTITAQDVIDFILEHPKGRYQAFTSKNSDYSQLAEKFHSLTGFYPTAAILEQAKEFDPNKPSEEDFAGNEPAGKSEEVGSVPNTNQKERRFTKQVNTDPNVKGEFKARITDDLKYYNNLPNVITLAEANYLIDTVGEDKAARDVMDLDNPITDAVRATVGNILLKRFEARGDYDAAINMLEYLTTKATETGRFIQAFAMWSRLTPEGQLRVAQRAINDQNKKLVEKDGEKISKGKSIAKKVAKEAIDEAVDKVVNKKVAKQEGSVDEPSYGSKNKIVTKSRYKEALAKAKKIKLFSVGFAEEIIEVAAYHAEASGREFGKFSKKIIRDLGAAIKPRLKELYDAAKEKLIGEGASENDFAADKEIEKYFAEQSAIKNDALEKRIAKQFEKAAKIKSDKEFKKAIGLLMSHPDRETIWSKYADSAAKRLKNISVSDIMSQSDSSPALKDFVDGMVKNIRQQMEESLPEKETTPKTQKSAIATIADAFKNFEKYKEVWEKTKEELQQKYADNPDALAEMDMLFGNVLSTPFSQKLVGESVTELIGKNLDKLIELYYQGFDTSSFEDEVVEKIIFETGLDESVIRGFIESVKTEIGDRKNESISKIEEKKKKAIDKAKNKIKEAKKEVNKPLWKERRDKSIKSLVNTLENRLFERVKDKKTAIEEFASRLNSNLSKEVKNKIQTKSKNKSIDPIQMLVEVLNNYEYYKDVINETQKEIVEKYKDNPTALMQFDDALFKIGDSPFFETLVKESVMGAIKSLDINIAKIARAHYTEYDATKRTLVDKLMEEADLPQAEAEQLAKAIGDEFDRILLDKKKSLIDALVKEKVVTKKLAVTLETEIEKLLNLGAFSDKEFLDKWSEVNGYPKLTPENLTEIRRLADLVQKAPDGIQKYRAMEDLLSYQAQIKGVDFKELMTSIWYANVLSGYNTQFVNIVSNSLNSLSEYFVMSAKNPSNAGFFASGWWNGIKHGLLEGKEVLKEGYNPIRGKLEIPRPLEVRSKLKQGKFDYSHAAKYVERVMVAADVVFYEGLREMKAYQLAASMAKTEEQKLNPDYSTRARAMAILNKADGQLKGFKDVAELEYNEKMAELSKSNVSAKERKRIENMYNRDRSRRVYELMKQREEIDLEKTADFARRATYNYKPEGVLGAVANGINMITGKIPALRFVVPFTNIVANVANETINYTPLGYIRAINNGGIVSGKSREILTSEKKADLLVKASLGTFAMGLALALTYDWDKDDDTPAWLEITGNGTGDFGQNYNLQENENWQSYSFRVWNPVTKKYSRWVKYQYSPLVVAFSIIGAVRDLERFKKEKLDNLTDIALASAVIGMRTFLDMSFLSTIDSFFNTVFNDFDKFTLNQFASNIANIGKGFVVPNLYTQAAKEIEAMTNTPMKNTPFEGNHPLTYISKWYQDLPVVRNHLNDKVNALGEPIIPITNKFVSGDFLFKRKSDPVWDTIAKYGMVNLKVPSQKVLSAYDPIKMENTPLTDDEYFYYCVERGQYIKKEIESVVGGRIYQFDKDKTVNGVKYLKGATVREKDLLGKDWMSSTQKDASKYAKTMLEIKRITHYKFPKGIFE